MATFFHEIEFEIHTCDCGMTWAFPVEFGNRRRKDHKEFRCPNGCIRYFPDESTEDVLKRKLKNTEGQLRNAQACCIEYEDKVYSLEKSRDAYKGHLKRVKKQMVQDKGKDDG